MIFIKQVAVWVGFTFVWIAFVAVFTYFSTRTQYSELEPRIEYGPAQLLGEVVNCEFDEPITVIVSIMNYYDNYDDLNLEHFALTGDDEEVWGWSSCEWQPDHNIAMCDVYTLMPGYVEEDPAMDTMGHEQVHGSCRDFHK